MMRETIFKSAQEMPTDNGHDQVQRTAQTMSEYRMNNRIPASLPLQDKSTREDTTRMRGHHY